MKPSITLVASTHEELQDMITEKIKDGYLICGGQSFKNNQVSQVMVLPRNTDNETSMDTMVIVGVLFFVGLYMMVNV